MAMPILPISPISVSAPIQPGNRTAASPAAAGGSSFGDILNQQLDTVWLAE